jgi:hypothetical protein
LDLFNRIYGGNKEIEAWKTVPKIMVYKKGEYYPYEGYFMRGMLLHFINRVINPVVYLRTPGEVEAFLYTEKDLRKCARLELQSVISIRGTVNAKIQKNRLFLSGRIQAFNSEFIV